MDPISLEDLALLETLHRIDRHEAPTSGDALVFQRLVESGLAEEGEHGLHLTVAGVEMCKSLQHRVAADAQAAKIVERRENDDSGAAEHGHKATAVS
jgi:hypothetical protein